MSRKKLEKKYQHLSSDDQGTSLVQVHPDSCTKFWQKPSSLWTSNRGTALWNSGNQASPQVIQLHYYRFKCTVALHSLSNLLEAEKKDWDGPVQTILPRSSDWVNNKYLRELCCLFQAVQHNFLRLPLFTVNTSQSRAQISPLINVVQ